MLAKIIMYLKVFPVEHWMWVWKLKVISFLNIIIMKMKVDELLSEREWHELM